MATAITQDIPVRSDGNAGAYDYGLRDRNLAPGDEPDKAFNYGKRIGILIVAYNALTTLSKVLRRIPQAVWRNIEEVAIFDDASQDETYELAVGFKTLSENTKLTVIRNERNLGYGGNQKAGYRYFLERGFDIVVLLHGDGQYAPEVLADLYHPIAAGRADAVFGSRMLKDYGGPLKGGMPLYKYLGNRVLTTFENRALGMKLSEFHSGYRAYNLKAIKHLSLDRTTDDFHFDTEIIIKLNHQRFRIAEVPIPTYYGNEICYVNGMKYAREVARAVIRYHKTRKSIARYPEFEEYFVRYPLKQGRYSSHAWVRRCLREPHDVLDAGCGEGFIARLLREDGHRVWGIDRLAQPEHREALEDYAQMDLDSPCDLRRFAGGRDFGAVLLLDVLEHLRKPEHLLAECRKVLAPDGVVVVSLPNVANLTVRLSLLAGRFDYAERGILDRTHLRFYTRRTARSLLEAAGFEAIEEHMTVMPLDIILPALESNPFWRAAYRSLAAFTRLMPGLLGYQTILVARPAAGPRIKEAAPHSAKFGADLRRVQQATLSGYGSN